MIHRLYNLVFTLFLLLTAPYSVFRALLQKGGRSTLSQRMGRHLPSSSRRPLWLHAASVGEVLCFVPLLNRLRNEGPALSVFLTTMTLTGQETARKHIPYAEGYSLLPWDHPWIIGSALGKVQPRLLLIAETELWPNLLLRCEREGIPVILFNGRISDRTFRRYLFLRCLWKRPLQAVSHFLMQTERDRERIIAMGAPPERVKVAGNIKFDQRHSSGSGDTISETAQSLGLGGHETLVIGGSTHSGEEEMLMEFFKEREEGAGRVLILAPRHLDRLEEVERALRREGIPWIRKSRRSLQPEGQVPKVILLDTMGELMKLYPLATLVFIGGSLVPVGGHNPLEPLFFKKCVIFGPHMFNFSEIARMLVEAGGAIQVKGKEELFEQMRELLRDEPRRRSIGERGHHLLTTHQGASEAIVEAIRPFLSKGEGGR